MLPTKKSTGKILRDPVVMDRASGVTTLDYVDTGTGLILDALITHWSNEGKMTGLSPDSNEIMDSLLRVLDTLRGVAYELSVKED